MQGYDSVVMDVDLEVGGNDQMFNMLAGRTLMKKMKNKEKCVLTMKLLEDQTGVKMGKTEGNMITLVDKPVEIYGKVMSWTDGMIIPGFEILTEVPLTEITTAKVKKDPMGYKKRLAKELVRELRGDREAQKAEAEFERVFQKKDKPQTMAKVHLKKSEQEINVVDLFIKAKLVASRSEARRLIAQKGLSIDDEIIRDPEFEVTVREGSVLRRGKRHFAQVIFKN